MWDGCLGDKGICPVAILISRGVDIMVERVDSQRVFPLISRAGSVKRVTQKNPEDKKRNFNERLREEDEKKKYNRDSRLARRPADSDACETRAKGTQIDKEERETGRKKKGHDTQTGLIDIHI